MCGQDRGMLETSARLLRLLSLLQCTPRLDRRRAGGPAGRDHPHRPQRRGPAARARLPGRGAAGRGRRVPARRRRQLPPLLLDDEEAVAVAIGLRTAASGTVAGIEETSVRALAKLQQVLPSRLRHRVSALQVVRAADAGARPAGGPGRADR